MSSGAFARFKEDSSFLRFYLWKYRRGVGAGVASLLMVDLLELLPPILLMHAVDTVIQKKPAVHLLYCALAYLGIASVQALGRYGWRMYLIRSSMLAGRDLRQEYASHLFQLSSSFFDRRKIGDLMSVATSDVEAIRMAMGNGLLTFADAFFYLITVPIAMLWLSPKLTLIAMIPLPLIPWFVARNEQKIHQRFRKVQDSFSHLSALAQENLNGIRVVKAFAQEDKQLSRFRKAGENFIRLNMNLARVQTSFGPMLDFFMSLGLVLLLWVGGDSVITGAVSLGTFVAFQRYIQKMVWPMTAIGMAINFYQRSVVGSERLKEILAVKSDTPESTSAIGPRKIQGKIEFRNLSFRFPGTSSDVLKGVNLVIEAGQRISVIGEIGSGKSALLSLIPRLYPVQDGMLFIDDIDINHWPLEELRKQVGYVSQEVFLFSETVCENVAYGLHQWRSSVDSLDPIEGAAKLAQVHHDVQGLSAGYQTRLSERGVNLSGGQKQRLTIARAVAKNPAILVLDDALSSVDVQTEEQILQSLRSRSGRNTEIISAHRISTVRDADKIIVFDAGQVRQQGTHDELIMDRRGAYQVFLEQQQLSEDLEQLGDAYLAQGGNP